ncbi:MAG TPA: hypothetical protein VNO52_12320 [Methylomirabilota bacterium]|nr:hypothetical protein [Methylomirabilota bacterium]
MKKLILSLTVFAFAAVSSLEAGEGKACEASKACAEKAKSECATACNGAKVAKKKVDLKAKGAALLVMR